VRRRVVGRQEVDARGARHGLARQLHLLRRQRAVDADEHAATLSPGRAMLVTRPLSAGSKLP